MDPGRIHLDSCQALLDGLVSAGVSQVVLSPGSRNTPLTLASVLHPQLQVQTVVDERSAAFFALGMAKQTGAAVALVCTSGTAVANWFPAVVEANRQQIPLILLSADRPWELQQCQSNQTIDQIKLFGGQVRAFHQLSTADPSQAALRRLHTLGRQLVKEASSPNAGPVHVNIPVREPLVPVDLPEPIQPVTVRKQFVPELLLTADDLQELAADMAGKKGVIVCGYGVSEAQVLQLAQQLACPVLADPLSGLRFASSETVISHYDLFLRKPDSPRQLEAEWILYFGGLPVSQALHAYLERQTEACQWWVDSAGRWMDRPGNAIETLQASKQALCEQLLALNMQPSDKHWLQEWRALEQRVEQQLQQQLLPLEAQVVRHALHALPDQSLLFIANSMSVRFMDAYSGVSNKGLLVHGNRGASGIDGNLSTLDGLACAYRGPGKVLGIVGDLAFFHDLNALALARDQDMIVLLLNNQGGGIFDFLPQHVLPEYEACWRTPVILDHQQLAGAFGIVHKRVQDVNAFAEAFSLALDNHGMQLIEIVIDSSLSNDLHRNIIGQWVEHKEHSS